MLHRAILGSIERFMGILIEHHNGHLPLWVSPVQAKVISVSTDQNEYAAELGKTLKAHGLRVETDLRYEKLGAKIRNAQMEKTPLMLVIGAKEVEGKTLSCRLSTGENLPPMNVEQFLEYLKPRLKPGFKVEKTQ
jgi:threonyl-tRNA synthetase